MKTFKDYLAEAEIQRYGAVGNSPGMGHSLAESGMAEADAIVRDIVSGEQCPYEIMGSPRDAAEKYVAKILSDEYEDVVIDTGLHADDDHEKIMDIVVSRLAKQHGAGISEDQSAGVLAAKELEADITNPMPGVHESTEKDLQAIVRLAGYR